MTFENHNDYTKAFCGLLEITSDLWGTTKLELKKVLFKKASFQDDCWVAFE